MRRLLSERKGLFAGNLFVRLIKDLLPFMGPILVGIAVDLLSGTDRNLLGFNLTQNDVRSIVIVAIVMAFLAVAKTVVGYVHTIVAAHMGRHVVQAARRDLANAAMQMSLDERRRFNSGDLLDRCLADSKGLRSFTQNVIIRIITNTVRAIFPLVVMFKIDVLLAVVVLAVIPLQSTFSAILQRRLQRQTRAARSSEAAHTSVVKEAIDGWNNVASVGSQDWAAQGIHETASASEDAKIVKKHTTAAISAVITLCTAFGIAAVYAIGGWRIISSGALDGTGNVAAGAMTLGTLTTFVGVAKKTYAPFQAYTKIVSNYRTGLVNLERIADVLDAPMIDPRDDGPKLKIESGTISLNDVSFTYGDGAVPTLSQLNGDIPGRSLTVITGSSGAGKTTLLRLLLGLDVPGTGTVSIDGQDINVANFASLQATITLVPQEPVLFTGTLRENLLLGRDDIAGPALVEACERAGLSEMIGELPFGLDTKVGSGRHMLSGGQLRRTAIARALLRRPAILLLDEPTTGLDVENSKLILATLRTISDHTTVIMVSHRSEPLKASDHHLILSGGGWSRSKQHVRDIEPSPESLAAIARAGSPTTIPLSRQAPATAAAKPTAAVATPTLPSTNGSGDSNKQLAAEHPAFDQTNSQRQNGHLQNGSLSNGSLSNGHESNGHESNGHESNGHESNGHESNGARDTGAEQKPVPPQTSAQQPVSTRVEQKVLATSTQGRPITVNALINQDPAVRAIVVTGHRPMTRPVSGLAAGLFVQVAADPETAASVATIDDINPDGVLSSRRLTALGVDLETDHGACRAVETQALHSAIEWLKADVTIDVAAPLASAVAPSETDVAVVVRFVPDETGAPSAAAATLARAIRNRLDRSTCTYSVSLAGCLPGSLTATKAHTVVELTAVHHDSPKTLPALTDAIVAIYRSAGPDQVAESLVGQGR